MAHFTAKNVKVLAELSTGHIITCKTYLKADGDYREWHESAPCEWMYGWTESEIDINESSIEVLYPDEFEEEKGFFPGATITKIIKVLKEPDWEVQDGWRDIA